MVQVMGKATSVLNKIAELEYKMRALGKPCSNCSAIHTLAIVKREDYEVIRCFACGAIQKSY